MSKKVQKRISRKTDPRIPALISALRERARQDNVPFWKDIAARLESPRQNYAEINLSKINRCSAENEVLLVPGKVLGAGVINHPVVIGALGFSASAKHKIATVGGQCMTIEEMMEAQTSASGIRILR
jgi:large subunit ribosomal protein L18e